MKVGLKEVPSKHLMLKSFENDELCELFDLSGSFNEELSTKIATTKLQIFWSSVPNKSEINSNNWIFSILSNSWLVFERSTTNKKW